MSDFFMWNETKYGLKIDKLDQEHKNLAGIMNKLYEQYDQKASYEVVLQSLNELASLVVTHFKNEEEFFMKIPNYEKAETHKFIHKDLLNKFTVHFEKFKQTKTLNDDFFQFLRMWLSAHIAGIDMQYANIYHTAKKAA